MSVVRFTPDGKLLAAGSHDGHVYLYDVLNNFKLKAKTVRGRKRESRFRLPDWQTVSNTLTVLRVATLNGCSLTPQLPGTADRRPASRRWAPSRTWT